MDGTDAGFEAFFRAEYPGLVRVLAPIVGDRGGAEAVAQDAFVKAMGRWSKIAGYDRPDAWVRRVAVRDAVRAAKRSRREVALHELRAAPVDVDGRLDLYQALARLPARQRAAVVLHHLAGWPTADIAEVLGCADATVRVHLHRGRDRLTATLSDPPEGGAR
jgi:RNA polymerase sigma-70 factor (ECF subfamily)